MDGSERKINTIPDGTDFLIAEYNQCFEHMRHYDRRQDGILKFAVSGFAAVEIAVFTIYTYFQSVAQPTPHRSLALLLSIVLIAGFLSGLVLLFMAMRNRLYYVRPTSQVNTLRKYFLRKMDYKKYNKMNFRKMVPAYKFNSTYTLILVLIALFNATLLSEALFFSVHYLKWHSAKFVVAILAFIIAIVVQVWLASAYLKAKDEELQKALRK